MVGRKPPRFFERPSTGLDGIFCDALEVPCSDVPWFEGDRERGGFHSCRLRQFESDSRKTSASG